MSNQLTPAQQFAATLAVLCETFGRELSEAAAEGYRIALRDLSADELAGATAKALEVCKFMPLPAVLRELAGRETQQQAAERAKAGRAAYVADAWEAVRTAMDRHDYTDSVDFGPLVNAVVRNLGGWVALCAKSVPDLVWVRKDFERLFEAFAGKPADELRGAPLPGRLGGPPIRIAIGGVLPPLQIEDGRRDAMRDTVRRIADEQSRRGDDEERPQ